MGSGNSYQSFIAEEVLWNAFRQDDEQAFSEMYRRFAAVLYNYGYHLAGDAAQVQDAMQDLFADLWRTRHNLSETTSVKYYLFRSLRRRLHRLSDAKAAPVLDWSLQEEASAEDIRITGEEDLMQQLRLQKAMLQLPARQQEAIRLRFYDNFSWEEISGIMGVNEQSVRNLVQRAVVKLRELL
ncbi:sigma-70 family RNA polymerase sigma factor [Chitinophaga sp.]|uniref:RNA polymerase sigma factor n=1 Tax=Chitinophaga sp. TaxID=1869181 RepID=UPI0031DD65DC